MKPISHDLRQRIVEVYEEGQLSYAKVAERFRVSEGSVKNFVKQWRETGTIKPKPAANGKTFLIDGAGEHGLKGLIEAKTDLSQRERQEQLAEKTGCVASQPTISRTLQRLNLTRKKVETCRRATQRGCQAGPARVPRGPKPAVWRGCDCCG